MLNRFTAILLLVCTLSANFGVLFVYAGFEVNRTTIASTLCENRDKPWMHCNGHCYLLKKIKQAEEKEKSEERQSSKSLFQEGITTTTATVFFKPQLLAVLSTPERNEPLSQFAPAIFQPPKLA